MAFFNAALGAGTAALPTLFALMLKLAPPRDLRRTGMAIGEPLDKVSVAAGLRSAIENLRKLSPVQSRPPLLSDKGHDLSRDGRLDRCVHQHKAADIVTAGAEEGRF